MKKYINSSILFSFISIALSCLKSENENNSITQSLPLPPTDLTASIISNSQVNLSWTDKSTNEQGFKIERKTSNSQFGLLTTTAADITSYTDNNLQSNVDYT